MYATVTDVVLVRVAVIEPDETAAVVSARVTTVEFDETVRVVCALPAVSVIEKLPAALSDEVTATPSAIAVEVAVIVHTVDDV